MKLNIPNIAKSATKLIIVLYMAMLCLVNSNVTLGQAVTNYSFSASSGTYTDLSGGTNPALTAGTIDDGYWNGLAIGFDFWYMGTRRTTFSASTNGWMTFGANITNSTLGNILATAGAPRPVVAPLWDDMALNASTGFTYKTTGSAPNRICTIEWLNQEWCYAATGPVISYQVILHETTGTIDFIYIGEATAYNSTTGGGSIGITATATGSGNYLSLDGTGTNPSASSTVETANLATKPADGQTYTFSQTAPTAPTNLTYTNIFTTSMTLNWTDNASNEFGYVIYTSTDGITYSFNQQVAAGSTSASVTGLSATTLYYFKVYAVREGALSTALTGSQSTATAYPYSASGSFVMPCGVTSVVVETWGCGGGGGSSNNLTSAGGSGGGGGAYAKGSHAVTPGTTYYYGVGTVGAGGPANSTTAPTAGGSAWFNRTGVNGAPANSTDGTLAAGGGAGVNNSTATPNNNGLASASYGNITTTDGSDGIAGTNSVGGGGGNGANPGGGTGGADGATGDGAPGNAPGGGGAGGNDLATNKGGDGGLGSVIIYYASGTPTIALGTSPTVCLGVTTANLPYTSTSNSPDQYSINYDATAEAQGFVDVGLTALPATPITLTVPGGAIAGTYNGTITVRNSSTGCSSSATAFTVTIDASAAPGAAGTITGTAYICQGQSGVAYSVPAITNATSYVWAYSGTGATINGTTNNITIDYNGSATSGNLTVYGTRSCGNGTISANYAVGIMDSPIIISNPTGTYGCNGTSLSFSVIATGAGLTYQWQENAGSWANISDGGVYSGCTTENVTISNPAGLTGRQYRCVVTGACGSPATSTAATLTVLASGMSGTYTVGTAGNYARLELAFTAINTNGLIGNVELQVITDITETATASLNQWNNCGNSGYTVTVYPTGATRTISGSIATSLVTLNGADYVTFDGRIDKTGAANSLVLSNTNTAGSALKFIADATYNTVKYCTLKGVSTATTTGVVWFSTATTTGNDFNTITYCDIRDGASTPTVCIYALGTSGMENNDITISYCNIYNFFLGSSNSSNALRVSTGNTKWTIYENSIYQTTNRVDGGSYIIYIVNTDGNEFIIENNYIGGQQSTCLGSPLTYSSASATIAFRGIYLTSGTSGLSVIRNNTIKNIAFSTIASGGISYSNISVIGGRANVENNIIGDNSTGSITVTINDNGMNLGALMGIYKDGDGNIFNNTIGSITVNGTINDQCLFNAIQITGTLLTDAIIYGNTVGNSSTSNSIQSASGATPEVTFQGIYFGTNGTYNTDVTSNTVANVNIPCTSSGSFVLGIINAATAGTQTIIGNTIKNLSTTSTRILSANQASMIGIENDNATTGGIIISDNTIHSLSSTGAAAVYVYGIFNDGSSSGINTIANNYIHSFYTTNTTGANQTGIRLYAGTAVVKNNMIRLGIDKDGNSITTCPTIYGIRKWTTSRCGIYYNTVYIGGTSVVGSTYNTFAFAREQTAATAKDTIENNIFVNARSRTSGSGTFYSYYLLNATNTVSNYNNYYVNGTGTVLGYVAANKTTTALIATATGGDGNSLVETSVPLFLDATGNASSVDLHLAAPANPPIGTGLALANIITDFDNQKRPTSNTCIGADERVASPGTNTYGIYMPEAQSTGTIESCEIVASGGLPGGVGILVGNPSTINYANVSISSFQIITQDNIQCTNTDIDFTTASGSPDWLFGNGSNPSTASTTPATTLYTSTGRKDIIENVKVFKDFTNLTMATPSSGTILGAPSGAGCPTTYAYTSSVAGSAGFTYNWTSSVPGGCTTTIADPTLESTDITFVNTTGYNQIFVLYLDIESECCGPLTQVVRYITIYPGPLPPAATDASPNVCTGGSQAISVSSPDASFSYGWYDASIAGTLLGSGTSYTVNPAISGATSYWVQATNSYGCASDRTEVVVTGDDTTIPTVPDNSTCGSNDVTLSITGPIAGYTYNWYSVSCGGTLEQTSMSTTFTTTISATTTFYVEAVPPSCGASACQTPDITYNAPPNPVVWLGAVGGANNWFNAANWTSSCIPACNANVSIPDLATDPDIGYNAAYNAACQNINLQSGAVLSFSDSRAILEVCGNFTHDGIITTNDFGKIVFISSSSSQTYSRTGTGDLNNVEISNTFTTPTVTLSNANMVLGTSGTLILTTGRLVTGSYNTIISNTNVGSITGHSSSSYIHGNLRRYIGASGSYDFPVGNTSSYQLANLNISSVTGLIYITTSFSNPADATGTGLPFTETCYASDEILNNGSPGGNGGVWTVTPDAGSANYTLTLNGMNYNNAGLCHTLVSRANSGVAWGFDGSTHVSQSIAGGVVTASRSGFTGFSEKALVASPVLLPIQLLYFTSVCKKYNELNWATAIEVNNNYFIIEKSYDGTNFSFVDRINGAGNSIDIRKYNYIDYSSNFTLVYYRLKQVDFNGDYTYSDIISTICNTSNESLDIFKSNSNNLDFVIKNAIPEKDYKLMIYDQVGKCLINKNIKIQYSEQNISLEEYLSSGIYNVVVRSADDFICKQFVIYQ